MHSAPAKNAPSQERSIGQKQSREVLDMQENALEMLKK